MLKGNNLKLKDSANVTTFESGKYLTKDFIALAMTECLLNNDPEGVIELLEIYIERHSTEGFSKRSSSYRSTIYETFKHKNPTIKTLAKILSSVN